jgi:predicted aconitase
MIILATAADERVADVRCNDERLIVDLMDGRTIAAPLAPGIPASWRARQPSAPAGKSLAAAMASTGRTSTRA